MQLSLLGKILKADLLNTVTHVLEFLAQRKHDNLNRPARRSRYKKACNAIFHEKYEVSIVRPVAERIENTDFRIDSLRYKRLFMEHGDAEADKRREEFLERVGAYAERRISIMFRHLLDRLPEFSTEHAVVQEWRDSYNEIRATAKVARMISRIMFGKFTRKIFAPKNIISASRSFCFYLD